VQIINSLLKSGEDKIGAKIFFSLNISKASLA